MSANTATNKEGSNLIAWSNDLSVGIQEIDEQHKILVDLLNQLHKAIIEHHGVPGLSEEQPTFQENADHS